MRYKLEQLTDESSYCETCGTSFAEGFELTDENGKRIMHFEPVANCTSPHTMYEDQQLVVLIKALGIKHGFRVDGLPDIDYGMGIRRINEVMFVHSNYRQEGLP